MLFRSALALSPDGELLFVANANNNNVAVFDVEARGRARARSVSGWWPMCCRRLT